MSVKKRIFQAVKRVTENVAYGVDQKSRPFPYVRYNHIGTKRLDLSNQAHRYRYVYQVDFYDLRPRDIEVDEQLKALEKAFKDENLRVSTWVEISDVEEERDATLYRYSIEVTG